jgi:predicted flap endonuclease-1-like 5' DNA nuclease
MMSEVEQNHAAMAAELRAHLSDDRAKLAADVAAARDERLADVEVRRAGWDSIAAALAKRRAGESVSPQPVAVVAPEPKIVAPEPEPVAPEPEPVAIAEPAKEVEEDLTRIRGIGPGMQAHLNAVGIFSFAKLAKADVDMLRLELGDVARLARIEEWIDQAEKLSQSG